MIGKAYMKVWDEKRTPFPPRFEKAFMGERAVILFDILEAGAWKINPLFLFFLSKKS